MAIQFDRMDLDSSPMTYLLYTALSSAIVRLRNAGPDIIYVWYNDQETNFPGARWILAVNATEDFRLSSGDKIYAQMDSGDTASLYVHTTTL